MTEVLNQLLEKLVGTDTEDEQEDYSHCDFGGQVRGDYQKPSHLEDDARRELHVPFDIIHGSPLGLRVLVDVGRHVAHSDQMTKW